MDADNFDEFLLASKGVDKAESLTAIFNKCFATKIDDDWDMDIKFVENDNFTIVNEEEEYIRLWNKLIKNKKEKHRAMELFGVRSLFKGKRVTGITFTSNDADLISSKCYLLEAFNLLRREPEQLDLKRGEEEFDWFTPIIYLETGKFLAVKTIDLAETREEFGDDLGWEIYAEVFTMQPIKKQLQTKIYVEDFELSNLILRYPKEVKDRVSEYEKLSEIFSKSTKFVKLENPKIEIRDEQEDSSQVEEEELWFGIRNRIRESTFCKRSNSIGPETKLFYGVAPSPEEVQYG
jgi:hypothetical protein